MTKDKLREEWLKYHDNINPNDFDPFDFFWSKIEQRYKKIVEDLEKEKKIYIWSDDVETKCDQSFNQGIETAINKIKQIG